MPFPAHLGIQTGTLGGHEESQLPNPRPLQELAHTEGSPPGALENPMEFTQKARRGPEIRPPLLPLPQKLPQSWAPNATMF